MDQIIRIKLSGSNWLDQIVWIKLSGSNRLDQIIWIKLSGSNYCSKYFARSQTVYQNILQGIKPYIKLLNQALDWNMYSKDFSKYSIIFEMFLTTITYQNIKNSQKQIRILWITRNFFRSKTWPSQHVG